MLSLRRMRWVIAGLTLCWLLRTEAVAEEDNAAKATVQPSASKSPQSHANEMKGKFQSRGDEAKTFRMILDGGFNVEFSYDAKTVVTNGGGPILLNDLAYGDEIIVHYTGKELNAIDIERVSKAPKPQ